MGNLFRVFLFVSILLVSPKTVWSQDLTKIIIECDTISDRSIFLKSLTNWSNEDIKVNIRNGNERKDEVLVPTGKTVKFGYVCTRIRVNTTNNSESKSYWSEKQSAQAFREKMERLEALNKQKEKEITPESNDDKSEKADVEKADVKKNNPAVVDKSEDVSDSEDSKAVSNTDKPVKEPEKRVVSADAVISEFISLLENSELISSDAIERENQEVNKHLVALENSADKNEYVKIFGLADYLKSNRKSLEKLRAKATSMANNHMERYNNCTVTSDFGISDSLVSIVAHRVDRRCESLDKLYQAIKDTDNSSSLIDLDGLESSTIINVGVIALIFIFLIVWFTIVSKRKSNKRKNTVIKEEKDDAAASIVVRRKTTSILKKQSIDDILDNKSYYHIPASEFCIDSAVSDIYIKNTCIKDIYNMYAEDLRNPDNPKEDGCMVLGRWVCDDETKRYSISLEEIVQPGDDAVFKEYELNFGGKIKLKVAEKLRKLRRDSNLQYDLTCWVHSHPGLGVFFSNFDTSVQSQLKHPSHPNFLIALVVDILTPDQEFGIFTFRNDSSMNSKNDLTKMYSLEELHKWAVESDRYAFKFEDYYNVLSKAERSTDECSSVLLSNSAIIDISSIVNEPSTGAVAWVQGYSRFENGKNILVVNGVTKSEFSPDNQLQGCLVVGTHCSIPSIRKAVAEHSSKLKFVLFYSISSSTLTVIPMNNNQLELDEKLYAEEKLEDLKIWTRRKR